MRRRQNVRQRNDRGHRGRLKKQGIEIDKKKVVLKENIKALGVFEIEIKVYAGISAKVKVNIVKAND